MKKLLIGAGAVAALVAGVGAANAADQVINLSGTVQKYCSIEGSASPSALTPTFPDLSGSNFIPSGAETDVSIGTVTCNSASKVTLSSAKGAALGPTGAFGFQNYVNYTASVSSPASVSLAANVTTGVVTPTSVVSTTASAGATTGEVLVHLVATVNTLPLVAGNYSDTLTVSINPTM